MYANMTLGMLIAWLEKQDADLIVQDGFGSPHSDRGSYEELAFEPLASARIGDMLAHAKSALGATFQGYKGGDYTMHEHTSVHIGNYGECGDAITPIHFKYWLLTTEKHLTLTDIDAWLLSLRKYGMQAQPFTSLHDPGIGLATFIEQQRRKEG